MTGSILVVDDDRNMRELLALHLRSAGYIVHTAADGVEGGYGVLRSRPDLIITDVDMPYMDGFELIAAIRSEPGMRNLPVIFLTTALQGEPIGKELGAACYVTKPVRADWLLSLIANHINGGRHPIG